MRGNLPKHPTLVTGACVTAAGIALVVACSAPTPSAPPGALAQQGGSGATVGSVLQSSNAAPTGAYFDFQVEKQASPYPGSPAPRYPDILQTAEITGEVIAQFVIDTSGHVEMNTFKVIKSDNDLFTDAVKSVLPRCRFYPAELGGRHVKELVQEPYVFNMKA
jgi:protein TonB